MKHNQFPDFIRKKNKGDKLISKNDPIWLDNLTLKLRV